MFHIRHAPFKNRTCARLRTPFRKPLSCMVGSLPRTRAGFREALRHEDAVFTGRSSMRAWCARETSCCRLSSRRDRKEAHDVRVAEACIDVKS